MSSFALPPPSFQNGSSNSSADIQPMHVSQPGASAESFGQIMNGLISSAGSDHQPSMLTQFARVPVAAYDQVMASINTPAPPDMSVLQSMEFYGQKQIDLNEVKTLQGIVGTVAKLGKRNIETIMNSK